MKDIITTALRLFIICVVSVFLLSTVNEITKPIIEKQEIATKEAKMKTIFPDSSSFSDRQETNQSEINALYEAIKDNKVNGYIMEVNTNGFGGNIKMMVGISSDGIIQGVSILSHSETPGLGAKAKEPEFIDQYKGLKINKEIVVVKREKQNDNEVEAITASTITSNAVTTGVNYAIAYFNNNFAGGEKQ